MEQLIKLIKKYKESKNPAVDGTAYALGNYCYEKNIKKSELAKLFKLCSQ